MSRSFVNFLSNKNLVLVLVSNTVLGSMMPMLIILGGLTGLLLAPSPSLSMLTLSAQMLCGLLAAAPMSLLMGRYGRKVGFIVGVCLGFAGSISAGFALLYSTFWLLIAGHMMLGAALVCFGYFRFAAAEVVSEQWQPVAISLLLGSGLIAALVGPEIFINSKDALLPVPFAGAYFAIAVIALIVLMPVLLLKPLVINSTEAIAAPLPVLRVIRRKPVLIAIVAAAVSTAVMVLMMTPTPLAMVSCGYSDAQAGDVIRWHVIAMFAPAFVVGSIIKKIGNVAVIAIGMGLLMLAGLLAAAGISVHHFYSALILLGIGWSFGFIGATSLLAQSLEQHERAKVQGVNDTLVALAATLASFGSGVLVSELSWQAVAYSGLITVGVVVAVFIITCFVNRATTNKAISFEG